jgi:hypothetical protein
MKYTGKLGRVLMATPLVLSFACNSPSHVKMGPYRQITATSFVYYDEKGRFIFEDLGKNGTPDIYFDWPNNKNVFLIRNGKSEAGYDTSSLNGARNVNAESEEGKMIANECDKLKRKIDLRDLFKQNLGHELW